jgi:hypothetical protein
MYEGAAPYRPRYTLPDYDLALRQGSRFLELDPPRTFDDATTFLLAMYANVPSITGYPVWFGDLDRLLEPFAADLDDDELHQRLRRFWVLLDRLFPDAFAYERRSPCIERSARSCRTSRCGSTRRSRPTISCSTPCAPSPPSPSRTS